MTSDFLSLISLGWVVTFPDSYCTVFTFCSWLDLLGVLLAFWIFNPKIFKLLQTADQGLQVSVPLESSLDHTLNFCRNLVTFHSKSMCQKVSLTGLLRWSSLQTKEGKRHTEFHLAGFEISQSLRRRQHDRLVIERAIGLVLGPSTALYRLFRLSIKQFLTYYPIMIETRFPNIVNTANDVNLICLSILISDFRPRKYTSSALLETAPDRLFYVFGRLST